MDIVPRADGNFDEVYLYVCPLYYPHISEGISHVYIGRTHGSRPPRYCPSLTVLLPRSDH